MPSDSTVWSSCRWLAMESCTRSVVHSTGSFIAAICFVHGIRFIRWLLLLVFFSLFQLILFSFECNARTERKKTYMYTYILLPSFTISISHCFLVYGLCYVQWIKTSISFKFQHRGVNNTFGKWTKTFNKRNQLVCTTPHTAHSTPVSFIYGM